MDEETGSSALGGAATGASVGAVGGPWGMAIGAAVGLIGGLLGAQAKKKKEAAAMKFQGTMMGLETQKQAANTMVAGNQNAFHQMMQGYQGITRR